MINGADNFTAGAQQMYTGEYRDSLVVQLLRSMGFSDGTADTVDWVVNLCSPRSTFVSKIEQNLASNASKAIKGNGFKPFTEDYYRENLKRLTGMNPRSNVHAHHVFPQQLREDFLKKGINIDNPRYLTWWEGSSHLPNAPSYSSEWISFMKKNPNTAKEQILEKGRRMMDKYGIDVNF